MGNISVPCQFWLVRTTVEMAITGGLLRWHGFNEQLLGDPWLLVVFRVAVLK